MKQMRPKKQNLFMVYRQLRIHRYCSGNIITITQLLTTSGIKKIFSLSFIHLAWDDKNVRGQDYFTCMQNIAANRDGGGEEKVWLYVNENWQRMVTRFGLDERYLGRMIPSICGRFNTNTQLDSV